MSYTGITINNVADGDIAWLCYCLPATVLNTSGGNIGQRVGFLELYRWSTSAPTTYPVGTSTYTWSDGTFTLPATLNGWSLTPGAATTGQTLWGLSVIVSDNLATATSTVTWPTSNTTYPLSYASSNTTRTAILEVYRWSESGPPTTFPTGTSTYTWATGQFTAPATLNSWTATPASYTAGQTLYVARQIYSDSGSSSTSSITWNTTTATNAGADTTTGFRIFKQITEGIATYYQDVTTTSPPSALITLSTAVTVDNTLVKNTGTGSFSLLQGKESQLIKIGSTWCVLNKYINENTIIIDRPLSTGGALVVPRYYPDIINDIVVGRITRTAGVYALEPYFEVKAENNSTVEFVTTLPSVGNYIGRTVVLSTDNLLYSWDGTSWVQGNPASITESATPPENPTAGSLWFRTTDSRMFIWDGTQWVQAVTGLSGTRQVDIATEDGIYDGETVLDTTTNALYVWDAGTETWQPLITEVVKVDLSNQAHTVSCLFNGTPVNLIGAETLISVYSGETNVTNLWTITPIEGPGVTGALTTVGDNKKYTVETLTQDNTYVDFDVSRTGYVTRQVRFTISKVRAGEEGGGGTIYRITNSAGAVRQAPTGEYTPANIVFNATSISGEGAPTAYNGYFKIETSPDGVTYTTAYNGTIAQSSYTFTITPNTTKFIRGGIYSESGKVNLLDQESIPVVSDGAAAKYLLVSGEQAFKFNESSVNPTNPTITLRADLFGGLSPGYLWEFWNGTAWTALSGTNNQQTYALSHTNTEWGTPSSTTLRVRCKSTIDTSLFDEITIVKLYDGTDTITGYLTNETHGTVANNDGTGYSLINAGGTFKVFKGTTDVTTSATFSVSDSPKSGLTVTIGASTGIYNLTGPTWTSDTEFFTLVATYGGVTIQKIYTITKSKTGSDSIVGYLTKELHTVSANSSGGSFSLSTAGGTFKVFKGLTDVTTSSTFTVVDGATKNGLTIAINSSGVYSLTGEGTWSSDSESFTLQAVNSGVTIQKVYTISKSKAGIDGTGSNGRTVSLTASSQIFTYNDLGVSPSPANTTITAFTSNTTGTIVYQWLVNDVVDPSQTGSTFTLTAPSSIANRKVEVRISDDGNPAIVAKDQITIVGIKPGTDSISGYLTNEVHTVSTNSLGQSYNLAAAGGKFVIFKGATVTTNSTFSILDGSPGTEHTKTQNGLTFTLHSTTGDYNLSGLLWNSDTESFTVEGVNSGVTIRKVYTISKSKAGVNGTNGTNGSNGINSRSVNLTTENQAFTYDQYGGAPSPANTTITATALNTTGTVLYEFFVNNSSQGLPSPTNTLTLPAPSSIANTVVRVEIRDGDGSTVVARDQMTVIGVRPGLDSFNGYLTNESHTVSSAADGTGYSLIEAGGNFVVFRGTTNITSSCTFSIVGASVKNGLTFSINSGGTYSLQGTSPSWVSDNENFTVRATFSGITIDKVYTITKSKAGVNGTNGTNGTNGARGPGRWHIDVDGVDYASGTDGRLPLTSADAAEAWAEGTFVGTNPGAPVANDQAWFFKGEKETPTGQSVWIYNGSSWNNQTEVIDGNLLVTDTITADKLNVSELSAVTANTGNLSVTGTFTLGNNGKIITSGTSYNTNGIFLGYDTVSGQHRFSIGGDSGKLTFDGTNLSLPGGRITAASIGADKLSVTSLSAVSATIGTLRTSDTGARVEIKDNIIEVYDSANTLRVRLGIW